MSARSYRIAVIPGDGVGKEVVPAAQQVLAALPREGEAMTAEQVASLRQIASA